MLRILVISELYPPHYIGGYELGCRDVSEALRERGHAVQVLTSTWGLDRPVDEGHVWRRLQAYPSAAPAAGGARTLIARELGNRRETRRAIAAFRPDVIYLWRLAMVSPTVPLEAERSGCPVVYYVSDPWLSQWEHDVWYGLWHTAPPPPSIWRRVRKALARVALTACGAIPHGRLRTPHVQFCSEAMRRLTPVQGETRVIPWGVDTERFHPPAEPGPAGSILYVGQLEPHKGVHTAVAAIAELRDRYGQSKAHLTVVGRGETKSYEAELHRQVAAAGLEHQVSFRGFVPRQDVPDLLRSHRLLVFPSEWAEPFSIGLLEAMASGLAIAATATGGTPEILKDGVNALVFAAGDKASCAAALNRLLGDDDLALALGAAARHDVADAYTVGGMVDRIEAALIEATGELPCA